MGEGASEGAGGPPDGVVDGRLDFQLVDAATGQLLPHCHTAVRGFDWAAGVREALARLQAAQAQHAERRLATHRRQVMRRTEAATEIPLHVALFHPRV
jgi:hypothetical protein